MAETIESLISKGVLCPGCGNVAGVAVGYPQSCGNCSHALSLPEDHGINLIRMGNEIHNLNHTGEIWLQGSRIGAWIYDHEADQLVADVFGIRFYGKDLDKLRDAIHSYHTKLMSEY